MRRLVKHSYMYKLYVGPSHMEAASNCAKMVNLRYRMGNAAAAKAEALLPGTFPPDDLRCRNPSCHSIIKCLARKGGGGRRGIQSEFDQESPAKSSEGRHGPQWPTRYFRSWPESNQRQCGFLIG